MEKNTKAESRVQDDIAIIDISGDVTYDSEKVLPDIYEKLTGEGHKKIALNFENVSYINSAGMAVLIGILTKSRNRDQVLRSWGLTDHFQKIFEMVGITKYMEHASDENKALSGF